MTTPAGKAIRGLAYRVARLDTSGATPASATGMIQKSCFVSIETTPDMEEAVEYLTKCADGSLSTFFRGPRVAKGETIAIELSEFDMAEQELVCGGNILTVSGAGKGYQPPALGTEGRPNGVSLEVWTPFVNGRGDLIDPANPYLRWVWPKIKADAGAKKIENGPMQYLLDGYCFENGGWGNGPLNDWQFDSSRVWQVALDSALPTPLQSGYQAVPTQT